MKKLTFTLLFSLFFLCGYIHAMELVPGQAYRISTHISDKNVLTVENSSLDRNASVLIWTNTEVNAQRWILESDAEGNYQLINAYSEKILYRKGNANDGAELCQYDKNDLAAGKWKITEVSGKEGFFYITQPNQDGTEELYLQVLNPVADLNPVTGSFLALHAQKTGTAAEAQMWRFEAVELESNTFNATLRDEIMKGWKDYYYHKDDRHDGYVIADGGFWADAEMIEIILDAYETTGDPVYEEMFRQLYINFLSREGTSWMWNDFNDDIAWMILVSIRGYLMFGDEDYFLKARTHFNLMYNRALMESGMLRWQERCESKSDCSENGTNSCINGPAEVAACYLGLATGDESYFEKARDLYALQRQYLYLPSTGQVFDSFEWVNGRPANLSTWASTYNQGTFIGAAVMLYNHYGDEQYKQDAKMAMKYTIEKMCDENGILAACDNPAGDLSGFKGILMRYVRRLIVDLGEPDYVEWLQKNAVHAYNNRNSSKVSHTGWLVKTPENFKFDQRIADALAECDRRYSDCNNCERDLNDCRNNARNSNDFTWSAFGPSTAVSAAFNAYLNKERVIKDAFSKIEAEDFDYLKGIYVKEGTDDNTPQVENIKDGFYTGYNNVVFGNNLANLIEVRVAGVKGESKIEVRLGGPEGELIGTIDINSTSQEWQTISQDITPIDGTKNIYLVYTSEQKDQELMKINYFRFTTDTYNYTDVTDNGGLLTSSLTPVSTQEDLRLLIDNKLTTVYRANQPDGQDQMWIQYQSQIPVSLKGYALGAADNSPEKDPESWVLKASVDGNNWVDLDTQTGQSFSKRYEKKTYNVSTDEVYNFYRLYITEVNGSTDQIQLAEWQLYGSGISESDITADGGDLSAQYEGNGSETTYTNLIDKSITSIYQVNAKDLWIEYASKARYKLSCYSITSTDGDSEKDPKDWILYGSEDGSDWVIIDKQYNQKFPYRNTTQYYSCTENNDYQYYKLHIIDNNGAIDTQIAEWQLYGSFHHNRYYSEVTKNGGKFTTSHTNVNPEGLDLLADNDGNTYYSMEIAELPIWIQYETPIPVQLRGYSLTVTEDEDSYPRTWTLQGSIDGEKFTNINSRTNIQFDLKGETKEYSVSNSQKFNYYRLNVSRLWGEDARELKIAEWQLHGTGISENDITSDKGGKIEAEIEGSQSHERSDKLIDKSATSKYCAKFSPAGWVMYTSSAPVKVKAYSITAANDDPSRDIRSWILEGSNDRSNWTVLDTRNDEIFPYRYATQYYTCQGDEEEYLYFRLTTRENNGSDMIQFSEWQLFDSRNFTDIQSETIWNPELEVNTYPNPVEDLLYIDMPQNGWVRIYDLSGQLVISQEVHENVNTIYLGSLNKGAYIMRIEAADKIASRRIIKK